MGCVLRAAEVFFVANNFLITRNRQIPLPAGVVANGLLEAAVETGLGSRLRGLQ